MISATIIAQEMGAQTQKKPFQIGITALTVNPHAVNNSAEAGFSAWIMNEFGVDLVFGYMGKKDDSYTETLGSGTIQTQTTSGTTTTFTYFDDGTDKFKNVTDAQMSFTIIPKFKAIKNKNSYFFVGVPVSLNTGYKICNNNIITENTWNNNGTVDGTVSDDYIQQSEITTLVDEDEYKFGIGYGIILGGAFQFESIPGLELSFSLGFRYGGAKKKDSTESRKRTVTTYDAAGTVLGINDYTNSSLDQTNGQVSKDEQGSGTFANGEVLFQLGVTYYFL